MNYIIIIFLVLLSGLFSGLTIGLTGLDKFELKRKMKLGSKKAKKVYLIRRHGNLLLCTLLLGNVAVNSTLSIFLGSIASGILAGLLATSLIVIFGEIIPAATCSRFALEIGSKTIWIIKIFIFILYPVCFPMSKILDRFLGEELPNIWSKKELEEIIKLHEESPESNVDEDEEKIILGALSFSEKKASDIMTPRTVVFALEENSILDENLIKKIKESGFTRIPIYQETIDNISGILLIKDLLGIQIGTPLKSISQKKDLLIIKENKKLDTLLDIFKKRRAHLAFIYDKYNGFAGLATLEDVVEEIIGSEIVDETDKVVNLQAEAKKKKQNII